MRKLIPFAISAVLLVIVAGCKPAEADPATKATAPVAPKSDGGNKPAVGPVGIKGTDLKPGGQANFDSKGKN